MKKESLKPKNIAKSKPIILVIGGHDPSGAGIHADIETISALGGQAVSIVTALTRQNTKRVDQVSPISPEDVIKSLDVILEEFTPSAVKIGLIPTKTMGNKLCEYLKRNIKTAPIVVDPIIKAGSGNHLATDDESWIKKLCSISTIFTPNLNELQLICKNTDLRSMSFQILKSGAKAILITDTGDSKIFLSNIFISANKSAAYKMVRYSGVFHGTGCTLSSAIAFYLAKKNSLMKASLLGQIFAHESVRFGTDQRTFQRHPNRFFKNEIS